MKRAVCLVVASLLCNGLLATNEKQLGNARLGLLHKAETELQQSNNNSASVTSLQGLSNTDGLGNNSRVQSPVFKKMEEWLRRPLTQQEFNDPILFQQFSKWARTNITNRRLLGYVRTTEKMRDKHRKKRKQSTHNTPNKKRKFQADISDLIDPLCKRIHTLETTVKTLKSAVHMQAIAFRVISEDLFELLGSNEESENETIDHVADQEGYDDTSESAESDGYELQDYQDEYDASNESDVN